MIGTASLVSTCSWRPSDDCGNMSMEHTISQMSHQSYCVFTCCITSLSCILPSNSHPSTSSSLPSHPPGKRIQSTARRTSIFTCYWEKGRRWRLCRGEAGACWERRRARGRGHNAPLIKKNDTRDKRPISSSSSSPTPRPPS